MKKLASWLILLSSTISICNAQTANPWASIDKPAPEILSLSQGAYPEVFVNDTLERIGSMMFNKKTNTIEYFISTDTLYSEATLEPTLVSRWLSLDPLAKKYPNISPYVFVGNNPILNIDPDGRIIRIHYQDAGGNNKYYDYGTQTEVPDNAFVQNTILAIDHIQKADIGEKVVNALVSAQNKTLNLNSTSNGVEDFHFSPVLADANNNKLALGTSADVNDIHINDGTVKYNPTQSIKFGNNNSESISPATALFHELGHAYSAFFKTKSFLIRQNTPDEQYKNKEERYNTINFENSLASFFGEGIRTDRSGEQITTNSPTSNDEIVLDNSITKSKGQGLDLVK